MAPRPLIVLFNRNINTEKKQKTPSVTTKNKIYSSDSFISFTISSRFHQFPFNENWKRQQKTNTHQSEWLEYAIFENRPGMHVDMMQNFLTTWMTWCWVESCIYNDIHEVQFTISVRFLICSFISIIKLKPFHWHIDRISLTNDQAYIKYVLRIMWWVIGLLGDLQLVLGHW